MSEKKKKGLAQLQTDVMLLVLFAAVTAAGFSCFGEKLRVFRQTIVLAESTEIGRTDPLWEKDGGFPAGRTVPRAWKPETDR